MLLRPLLLPRALAMCGHGHAIDCDSKMILAYEVGDCAAATAREFMFDLTGRLADRVQLMTDGHGAYLKAVGDTFAADINYAVLAGWR